MAASSIPSQSPSPNDFWLFSRSLDLLAFLGSAVIALVLLIVGHSLGVLHSDTPSWAWVPAILLIDVAHVYCTAFRVYFDAEELKRRPLLYTLVPLFGFIIAMALYSEGEVLFWRVLAYLAVFHFVRQQYGWVMLYRAKRGEQNGWGRRIDVAAIYLATIYPLVYWHAHLPREFRWFLKGDFLTLPELVAQLFFPVYCLVMCAYVVKSIRQTLRGQANPGKDIVMVTTAACWYLGIVQFNSDYAFTVTNVIIHGIPYMVLVYWYMRHRVRSESMTQTAPWKTCVMLIATIWLLAYTEVLLWDRAIWQKREWLFGSAIDIGEWSLLLVPLLAVPQLTHYLLDGFIWKRKNNPSFNLIRK